MTTTSMPWRPGPVVSRSDDPIAGSPTWAASATETPVTRRNIGIPLSAGPTHSQSVRAGSFPFPFLRWTILDSRTVGPSS